MSLATRAGDLFYTFRFIKMLTTPFNETDAYKLGIIDERGNRIKSQPLNNAELKSAYTTFHRLVFNIKKLLEKIPMGKSKLASYAAALFLLKEKYDISDKNLEKIIEKCDIKQSDILNEYTEWYLLENKQLAPGVYKVYNSKVLSESWDEVVNPGDKIRVSNNCYPVGEIFGLDIYKAEHINTGQTVHITISEIYR